MKRQGAKNWGRDPEGVARSSRGLKLSAPGAKLWVVVACVRGYHGSARGDGEIGGIGGWGPH